MYDMNYKIYKYIDKLTDEYVEFDELLKQNNLKFAEAKQQSKQFKEEFYAMLAKYSIRSQNLVVICCDLMERICQRSDDSDLHYLYLCVMTNFGLLISTDSDRTEEQLIRNYFDQWEALQELTDFCKSQNENFRKYQELLKHLKKPIMLKHNEYAEEADLLYRLTIQHTFLYESSSNEIYRDNLNTLLTYINSDETLRLVKPYIIFAVLARKTGMMQNRPHFMSNLKAVLQYQDYNIYKDNGKNFNRYQSELELYDHLQRSYIDDDDVDMGLCDFCFANLSPLSEWYYMNCELNEDIPMRLSRKILTVMPKSFPDILSYSDYEEMNESEIQLYGGAAFELKDKMLQTADDFLKI